MMGLERFTNDISQTCIQPVYTCMPNILTENENNNFQKVIVFVMIFDVFVFDDSGESCTACMLPKLARELFHQRLAQL